MKLWIVLSVSFFAFTALCDQTNYSNKETEYYKQLYQEYKTNYCWTLIWLAIHIITKGMTYSIFETYFLDNHLIKGCGTQVISLSLVTIMYYLNNYYNLVVFY